MTYCLGLIFDWTNEKILLQYKANPAWQRGRYNGVGGKLEPSEVALDAMIREGREEVGINAIWTYKLRMEVCEHVVFVYRANFSGFEIDEAIKFAAENTHEPLCLFRKNELPYNALTNLRYIVPMCADDKFINGTLVMGDQS